MRIYGHYATIDEDKTNFYRHSIYPADITNLGGKERWKAYKFTKNVYDIWMPIQHKRICSAIDDLPSELNFDPSQSASLPQTEESSGFKRPGQPASKMRKAQTSQLKDQLANQGKEQQERIAELLSIHKEQIDRQDKQIAEYEKRHAEQEKRYTQQEARHKKQMDLFQQFADRLQGTNSSEERTG